MRIIKERVKMKRIFVAIILLSLIVNCFAGQKTEKLAEELLKSTVKVFGHFIEEDVMFDDELSWSGTGVIIEETKNEYTIVTNLHVLGFWAIYNADATSGPEVISYSLMVKMYDGKTAKISKVLINEDLKDFALIKIEKSVGDYPAKPLQSKMPAVGESVYAMGHPMGLDYSFTAGIISGQRMFKSDLGKEFVMLQTDTPINSGNSGGPLVDDKGGLIGINTSGIAKSRAEGLNFAIWSSEILQSQINNEFIEFPLSSPRKIGLFVEMMKSK